MKQAIRTTKLRQSFQGIGNEKGQAVVEYVLILVITLTMLAAVKGMFKAVDDFMYSYMGAYISCLMEYGELPAQGVEADELKKNKDGGTGGGKVCDSSFKNFNLADGISPNPSSSSSGASQNGVGSRNFSQSATANSKDKTPVSRPTNSASENANLNSSSSYANGKVQRASSQSRAGTADNSNRNAGDDKVRVIEDQGDEAGFGGSRSSNIGASEVNYEKVRYKAISGKLADTQKAKANRAPTAKIIQEIVDENRRGPRRSVFAPPEKRAIAAVEDDGEDFNFGYFLKWIIIAGILISIFIFFGSQVMSFMNSKEK